MIASFPKHSKEKCKKRKLSIITIKALCSRFCAKKFPKCHPRSKKSDLNICAQSSFSISNNSLAAMESECILRHMITTSPLCSRRRKWRRSFPNLLRVECEHHLRHTRAFFFWLRVKGPGRTDRTAFFPVSFDFDPLLIEWKMYARTWKLWGILFFWVSSCWFYQVAMSECPQPWTTVPLL